MARHRAGLADHLPDLIERTRQILRADNDDRDNGNQQ